MDMLKKAQKKAMAAVKEVQNIVQTPGQQQQSYQQSYQQNQQYQQYQYQHSQAQQTNQMYQPQQQYGTTTTNQNVLGQNQQYGQQVQLQQYHSPTPQTHQTQYFPPQTSATPQTNQLYSSAPVVPQTSQVAQSHQSYPVTSPVSQTQSPQGYQHAYSPSSQVPQGYGAAQGHNQAYTAPSPISQSYGTPQNQQVHSPSAQGPQSYGPQRHQQIHTPSPQVQQNYGTQVHQQVQSPPPIPPNYGTQVHPQVHSPPPVPQSYGTPQNHQPAYPAPPPIPKTSQSPQGYQQTQSPPQQLAKNYGTPQGNQQIHPVPTSQSPQNFHQAQTPPPKAPQSYGSPQGHQQAQSPPQQIPQTSQSPQHYQQAYQTPSSIPQTSQSPRIYQQTYPTPSSIPQTPQSPQNHQVYPAQVPQSSGTPQTSQPAYSPPQQFPQNPASPPVAQPAYSPPSQVLQNPASPQNNQPAYSLPQQVPQNPTSPPITQPAYSPPSQVPQNPASPQNNKPAYSPPQQVPHNPASLKNNQPVYAPPSQAPQGSGTPQATHLLYSPTQQLAQASQIPPMYLQPHSPPPQASQISEGIQPSNPPNSPPQEAAQTSTPIQQPTSQYPSPPPILQGKPDVNSYSDSHPQLLREDSGLIAVISEESYHQPHFQVEAPHSFVVRKRQLKCSGFDGALTDIVQFFELKDSVVKAHNLPVYKEGGCLAICEYCFYAIIGPHPWFANCFELRPKGAPPEDESCPQISYDKIVGCGLAFPSIRQIVINQVIPRKSIQPFISYVRLDSELQACSGQPSSGGYYGSRAIEDIALCQSCFECYIRGTSFEREFSLMHMPRPDQQWICDVGYSGYIQRTLLADLAKNPQDFSHFAIEAQKRLQMPSCSGTGKPMTLSGPNASSCFRSVTDNCGVFCSSCFYDVIAGSPAEKDFGYQIELEDENQKATLACDLAEGVSKYAMSLAVQAGKFDVWHGPIVAKVQQPLCPSIAGKDEADLMVANPPQTWYYFNEYPEIEICPRCYGMNVYMLQATDLFSPITRPMKSGRIRQCYLSPVKEFSYSFDPMDYENTTAWRGQYLRNALTYGRDAGGDFTVARQVAKHIASLPPACGSELRKFKQASGRRFFGHQTANHSDSNDCTLIMCEECHLYSVKGTPLESFLSEDLTSLTFSEPEGHRCSTWSRQCKRRLRTACETQDFASYAQWHHKREDVYTRLWTIMNELKPMYAELKNHTARINRETEMNVQMGGLRLQQQMNAQTNATIMGIGGSVAEAAASDTGYRYGNSTVSTGYLTAAGANAAQAQHDVLNRPGVNIQPNWSNVSLDTLTAEIKKKMAIQEDLRQQWAIID